MTKAQMELIAIAHKINETMALRDEIRVNRRNGYYAIDTYDWETGEMTGNISCGNFADTKVYLRGMIQSIWMSLPF